MPINKVIVIIIFNDFLIFIKNYQFQYNCI